MERGEEVQICGSPHDGGEHGRGMQLPMMQHIECSVFLSKSLSSGEKKMQIQQQPTLNNFISMNCQLPNQPTGKLWEKK